MAKGPGRICLKPCQEAKGKTEGSLFHVGSAGEDCFLTWFMKTNICEMEPFFFFFAFMPFVFSKWQVYFSGAAEVMAK